MGLRISCSKHVIKLGQPALELKYMCTNSFNLRIHFQILVLGFLSYVLFRQSSCSYIFNVHAVAHVDLQLFCHQFSPYFCIMHLHLSWP